MQALKASILLKKTLKYCMHDYHTK